MTIGEFCHHSLDSLVEERCLVSLWLLRQGLPNTTKEVLSLTRVGTLANRQVSESKHRSLGGILQLSCIDRFSYCSHLHILDLRCCLLR